MSNRLNGFGLLQSLLRISPYVGGRDSASADLADPFIKLVVVK